jgi:dephospho-CoA kinase
MADHMIVNESSLKDLKKDVDSLLNSILGKK